MKKILLVLILANALPLQAQILNVNSFNENGAVEINERKIYNGFSFHYSFQYTDFTYQKSNLKQFNNFKHSYGNSYNFRYLYYPLILDISFFASHFTANSVEGIEFITHRGTEYSASYLFPIHRIEKILPYIGIGYQISTLSASSSIETSSVLWKMGTLINFSPNVFVDLEFKSSFKYGLSEPFNQFSIGVGMRGEPLYKTLKFIGRTILFISIVLLDFY